MNLTGLLLVTIAQFLSGSGIVRLFRLQIGAIANICLSMIVGIFFISLAPAMLQLAHIPITGSNTAIAVAVITALCSIPLVVMFRKPNFSGFALPELYEIPFLLVFLAFFITSAFRCYYFPPTPRDVLAGGELLAEFTIREKTMLNSVFSIDLHTTNNHFKSPYITCLQVVYKLFVSPFGGVWLTAIFVPFTWWLYTILKERVHGLVACTLLLMYFCIPDAFAYSYIILYDYSNMIFYFTGFYFLMQYQTHQRRNDFAFSILLFGIATYIRVETLVLVSLAALMPAYTQFKAKQPIKDIIVNGLLLMAGPVFFYVLCMNIFIPNFVPVKMDTAAQINHNMSDISVFFTRISAINNDLILSDKGLLVYGYFFYYFIAILLADLVLIRKFNKEARMALYGIAVVYFGLALLGYLLPLFDVMNTTKRGLFKLLPLILMYYANSGIVTRISDFLKAREARSKQAAEPALAGTRPAPRPATKK
ncbi:MAG: hypothetical protein JNM41_13685 [Flavipsychrobacter sp.]|nr:hypothetical protein [Flavipsychrobacter sp.]